jgi:hypothetical protein
VSAAVDAALCLLLVSASVATLTAVSPPETAPEARADRGLELVGTTATVSYDGGTRVARGTVGALLADAAVARADGGAPPGYVRAVANATRRALAGLAGETQVRVSWRPAPGEPVAGRVTVGAPPPPGVDVRAARTSVAVGSGTGDARRGRAVLVVRGWRR